MTELAADSNAANVPEALDDARALVNLLKGIPAKINLIPFNPFPASGLTRSTNARVQAFAEVLVQAGIVTTVRKTRGDDIDAACGQLKGQVADRTRRQAEHLKRLGEVGDGVDAAA